MVATGAIEKERRAERRTESRGQVHFGGVAEFSFSLCANKSVLGGIIFLSFFPPFLRGNIFGLRKRH